VTTWHAPTLEGRLVRLEPLTRGHADALWDAARDARTWRWLSIVQPSNRAAFDEWLDAALTNAQDGTELPLATLARDRVVGSTRYLALRPEHGSVEIGWTWLHPDAWGTGVNVEAKLLMLQAHAGP
jgi:RimJ/RimL family protein N-acetyltransferase